MYAAYIPMKLVMVALILLCTSCEPLHRDLEPWGELENRDTVVSASLDGTIRKFDPRGNLLWTYENELLTGASTNGVIDVAVDPGGFVYAVSHHTERVIKLDAAGDVVWYSQLELRGRQMRGVAVDPDGNVYIAANADGVIKLNSSGDEVWHFDDVDGQTFNVVFGADGHLYSASSDNTTRRHNAETGAEVASFSTPDSARAISVHPDGTVYVGCDDNTIYVFDTDGDLIETFDSHVGDIYRIALHPDGYFVSSSQDETVRKIDGDLDETWRYSDLTDRQQGVAVLPGGEVYIGGRDNLVQKLDAGGGLIWTADDHTASIHGIAAHPGRYDTFPDAWHD